MTSRSLNSTITFESPFSIGAQTEQLPAGAYRLMIEEEMIEGLSFAAYRRVSTTLEIPALGMEAARKQYIQIAADDLDAALEADRLRTGGAITQQKRFPGT
jgi:hypothetical protein